MTEGRRFPGEAPIQLIVGLVLLGSLVFLEWSDAIVGIPTIWRHVMFAYATLVVVDGVGQRDGTGSWLFSRVGPFLFAWSVPLWLITETLNFRADEWYYVGLPTSVVSRRLALGLLFAAILPSILFFARVISTFRFTETWAHSVQTTADPTPPPRIARGVVIIASLLAVLAWPRGVFATWILIFIGSEWAIGTKQPSRSALRGWGVPRLAICLPLGGILWGLGLETLDGILGPVVVARIDGAAYGALAAWLFFATYTALTVLGIARLPGDTAPIARFRTAVASVVLLGLAGHGMWQVDRRTVSSTALPLSDLPDYDSVSPEQWSSSGITDLISLENGEELPTRLATDSLTARRLQDMARLARLRSIGITHTIELDRAGVHSVCELAAQEPEELWITIHALFRGLGPRPSRNEVRGWHRAAEQHCRPPLGGRP